MHFDGLFDCSKGHFNKLVTEDSCQVMSRSILYLVKRKYRIDVKGDEGEGQLLTSISIDVKR